jgi:hypothetical protein
MTLVYWQKVSADREIIGVTLAPGPDRYDFIGVVEKMGLKWRPMIA